MDWLEIAKHKVEDRKGTDFTWQVWPSLDDRFWVACFLCSVFLIELL